AAYAAAIRPMFLIAAAVGAVSFLATWLLQEHPLRETVADQGIRDSFATPREITSVAELETRLSTLAHKQNRHQVYDHLTELADLDLSAPAAWLLLRLDEHDAIDDAALADYLHPSEEELRPLLDELRSHGLVERDRPKLTETGEAAATKLTE